MSRAAVVGLLVLAFASTLVGAAQAAPSHSGHAGPPTAVTASIDIGELFGNENEADENEADEGGAEGGQAAGASHASGVSWPVVLLLVAAAAALGGFVYLRIRRMVLRFRAWGRRMWARL